MMRLTLRNRLAVVVLGASAVTGTVLLARPIPSHAAQPPTALTDGFQDHTSNDYLRVQLDPTAANYGGFVVAVPGVGLVWAADPATASVKSDHSVQLRYDGSGYLDAQAQLDTEFGVGYQLVGAPTPATVRLIGQVDPAHGSGSIEIWINGTHYHFAAGNAPQDADSVATAVVAALKADDWPSLYGLADDSLRNGMTAAQFGQQVAIAFGAGTKITDVAITGSITYTTNQAGVSYADVPITMTILVNGIDQTTPGVLVLIDDQGAWRWFTTKPAS